MHTANTPAPTAHPSLHEITQRLSQRYRDLDARLDQITAMLDDLLDGVDTLLEAHGVCSSCLRPVGACEAQGIDPNTHAH